MVIGMPGAIWFPADPSNYYHWENHNGVKNTPRGWVLHTPEEPADNYPSTPHYFQNPGIQASTHYFLAYTGDIYQMVNEEDAAIANGVKNKPYPSWADRSKSLNWQSVNVEIEGFGYNIGQTLFPGTKQWEALIALISDRAAYYNIPLDREHIIGHYQVSDDRSDPGPSFMWDQLIADLNGEDDMIKVAPWWTGRRLQPGRGEINLNVDFGPAKAYDIRVVMAPDSKGPMRFKHGDFKIAAVIESGQRAASFMLVPGPFGTAPFEIDDPVSISYLACAGVIQ